MRAVIFSLSFLIQHLLASSHSSDKKVCGSVAFHVYRKTSYELTGTIVPYEEERVNSGSMDLKTGIFHAPYEGIYVFNFLAESNSESCFHAQLKHNGLSTGYGYSCSVQIQPIAYIALLHLEKNDRVWVHLWQGIISEDEDKFRTHFTGFMLTSVPSMTSAFHVFRNSGDLVVNNIINYDGIYTDVNADLDAKTGTFTAPVDGVYFFQFVATSNANNTKVNLTLGNETIEFAYAFDNKISPIIFHSIVSMKQEEILQAHLLKGSIRDEYRRTSFIGFLMYESNVGGRPLYFHVGRKTAPTIDRVVTYDHVVHNVRNAMDPKSGVFTAPDSGVFAFYFFASTKNNNTNCTSVQQMHNNVNNIGTSTNCAFNTSPVVFNSILHLKKGDQVKMVKTEGNIESDPDIVLTRFSGFLIYPTSH